MPERYTRLSLRMPGIRIADADRDWAFRTQMILTAIKDSYGSALAAFTKFIPATSDEFINTIFADRSGYLATLNNIYAKSFVLSLHMISKLLTVINGDSKTPNTANAIISEYEDRYGQIKHIRDSIAHIEDRIRLMDRRGNRIPGSIIVLGSITNDRYEFTGSDGNIYGIPITEIVITDINRILQGILDSYNWERHGLTTG